MSFTTGQALTEARLNREYTDIAFSAGNFTGGGGTWTVGSGDQSVFRYRSDGKVCRLQLALVTTTVAGTTNQLSVALPFTAAKAVDAIGRCLDNGTDKTLGVGIAAGTAVMLFSLIGGANWAASTNASYFWIECDVPV